jgi:hypothetical protein
MATIRGKIGKAIQRARREEGRPFRGVISPVTTNLLGQKEDWYRKVDTRLKSWELLLQKNKARWASGDISIPEASRRRILAAMRRSNKTQPIKPNSEELSIGRWTRAMASMPHTMVLKMLRIDDPFGKDYKKLQGVLREAGFHEVRGNKPLLFEQVAYNTALLQRVAEVIDQLKAYSQREKKWWE